MKKSEYWIIDERVKYVPDDGLLVNLDEPSTQNKIDNLESILLNFLLQHPGIVHSKETLLRLWPTAKGDHLPQEGSLSRVMSMLRKKLQEVSGIEGKKIIKTEPRIGFIFVLDVKHFDGSADSIINIRPISSNPWLVAVAIVSILVAILSNVNRDNAVSNRNESPHVEVYKPNLQKLEHSVSNDGQYIAYSARTEKGTKWHVIISGIYSSVEVILDSDVFELNYPIFETNGRVLLRVRNDDYCGIHRVEWRNPNEQASLGQPVAKCNVNSISFSMALGSKGQVYVTETDSHNSPSSLKLVNLDTGRESKFMAQNQLGIGVYRVFTASSGDLLATLSSDDWASTDVNVYDLADLNSPKYSAHVEGLLFSVALFDNGIVYKNGKGGFQYTDFSDERLSRFIPVTLPHYSPIASTKGFSYLAGEFTGVELSILSREFEGIAFSVTKEEGVYNRSLYLDESKFYYSSNRTGIEQVWEFDLQTQVYSQITEFIIDRPVYSLAYDPAASAYAIARADGIYLLTVGADNKPSILKEFPGRSPVFKGGRLFFTNSISDDYGLFSIGLDDLTIVEHNKNGAFNLSQDGGELYYTKYSTPGIFDMDNNLIQSTSEHSPKKNWSIRNGVLYIGSSAGGTIESIDLSTGITVAIPQCNDSLFIIDEYCVFQQSFPNSNRLFYVNL